MAQAREKNNPAAKSPQHVSSLPAQRCWRKWLFRLAALVLSPLIFFGALEGILRLIGYGYPTSFFLHQTANGEKVVIENNKFGWRFFGPALARMPYPLNFPEAKSPDTIRIFVFGESAAFGDPQPDFGLPRVLATLLRDRYPGVRFEVINAAMVAINSHVILPIARECASERGDIWLIYMGNNEVVGPFGGGTVFGPQAPSLPMIRTSLAVKSTRTGEVLSDLLARAQGRGMDSAEWRGLMMFVRQQVRQDDPRMARVYSHFEKNLSDILLAGVDHGAKIIVSTVASNLRNCAPFASQHSPDLSVTQSNEWARLYQTGIEAEETGDAARAAEYYQQAAKVDDSFADLQFRWARTCVALKRKDEARKHFILARDYDVLRFRADSRINEIIRHTAMNREKEGITFVDAANKLAEQSPDGLCGEEMFYEHVHFTFEGNYALARMFADEIAKCLPDSVTRRADPQLTWLVPDECARRIGWNDWSKQHTLQSLQLNVPPFSYQLNHGEMLRRVRRQAEQLASALTPVSLRATADEYRQLISASPDDWVFHKNLAQVLQELEDPAGAAKSWRQVEKALPQNVEAPLQINLILTKEGKLAEAAEEYMKAFRLDRNAAEWSFAKLLNETGARIAQKAGAEPAVPLFEQALALKPNFAEAHISLGSALNALGKTNQAREHFRAALRHPPTTPQGLVSLGEVCYRQGWTNEAVHSLQMALALDPTDAAARFHLGVVLFDEKENSAALDQFREVLRLDPDNTKARQYLIQTNR